MPISKSSTARKRLQMAYCDASPADKIAHRICRRLSGYVQSGRGISAPVTIAFGRKVRRVITIHQDGSIVDGGGA